MAINPELPIKFSRTHRLQWEEAQQKDVILYPEGMVELNQSSAEILKLCDGTRNLAQLISELEQKFNTSGLTNDITASLRSLYKMAGLTKTNPTTALRAGITPPRWLLAELTYACPLQCPYCANPIDYAKYQSELSTEDWKRVLTQARKMGAVQLGFSGGEPLTRKDLAELVKHARDLGYYSNLITSGYGLTEEKIIQLKEAGLDHIQVSIQASTQELNDHIAGTASFEHKKEVARLVKKHGYPMVLCVVIHRENIHQMAEILTMAEELGADYLELANTQYYGWAHANRDLLLPTKEQFEQAEAIAQAFKETVAGKMKIYYVVPDFYEDRPKACMNGWGTTFLTIAPDGVALPCHSARELPALIAPMLKTSA